MCVRFLGFPKKIRSGWFEASFLIRRGQNHYCPCPILLPLLAVMMGGGSCNKGMGRRSSSILHFVAVFILFASFASGTFNFLPPAMCAHKSYGPCGVMYMRVCAQYIQEVIFVSELSAGEICRRVPRK